VRLLGRDVRGDTAEKPHEAGCASVPEVRVGVEDILEGLQQRIVIERRIGNRAGLDKRREKHGAGPITPIALKGQADGGSNIGGLRKGHQIWTGLFVAAEKSRGKDGEARRRRLNSKSPLVKIDDDKAIALIGGRSHDERDPLLQERIGRDQAARLAVFARSIVAIVAKVGRNEDKVGGLGLVKQILRQEIEVDDVRRAIG